MSDDPMSDSARKDALREYVLATSPVLRREAELRHEERDPPEHEREHRRLGRVVALHREVDRLGVELDLEHDERQHLLLVLAIAPWARARHPEYRIHPHMSDEAFAYTRVRRRPGIPSPRSPIDGRFTSTAHSPRTGGR